MQEPKTKYWTWLEAFDEKGEMYFVEVTCDDIYYFIPEGLEFSFVDVMGEHVDVEYDEQLFELLEEQASLELHNQKYGTKHTEVQQEDVG